MIPEGNPKAEEFWADQEVGFSAVYDFSGCTPDFHHFVPALKGAGLSISSKHTVHTSKQTSGRGRKK